MIDAAAAVRIDPLAPDAAVELLAKLVGRARIAAEPDAAQTVVEQCGYLPLALRLADAHLRGRAWTLKHFAERLADEAATLDVLDRAETSVWASCLISYHQLDETAATFDQGATAAAAVSSP